MLLQRASRSFPWFPLFGVAFLIGATGCLEDPSAPQDHPLAQADIIILNLRSTIPDPESLATCQTGASIVLDAGGSQDPAGQPLLFEWRDEVDYGDGVLFPSADWGFESNVLRTSQEQQAAQFYTIGLHFVTLTVHTRDGRTASRTLRVRVTACEACGIP